MSAFSIKDMAMSLQEEFHGAKIPTANPTKILRTVDELQLQIANLQKANSELARALNRKDMMLRSAQCFNTTIITSNLRKEKTALLGKINQLSNIIKDKDNARAAQGVLMSDFKDEVQALRSRNAKLEKAAETKDKKISRLQAIVADFKRA